MAKKLSPPLPRRQAGPPRRPRRDRDAIRFLTTDECTAVFRAARKASRRDHAILLLAYRHGLRASEVGLLKRDDLDLKTNRIRFRRLKGSMDGVHPLEPDEAQALRSYLRTRKDDLSPLFISRNRRPISRAALDDVVRAYAELAGVPKDRRSFHVLKHSIAMHLLDAGTRVETVRDWLGHRNIQNTLVYAKLTNPTRDAEVARALGSRKVAR